MSFSLYYCSFVLSSIFWSLISLRLSSPMFLPISFFFFKAYGAHRDLPSSPPRRSSDLLAGEQSLVSEDDLSQVKPAFALNGWVGLLYLMPPAVAISCQCPRQGWS